MDNARFVQELQLSQPKFTEGFEIANYMQLRRTFKIKPSRLDGDFLESLEKALPFLNRVSTGDPNPFWELANEVKDRIYLPTEKFFWNFPTINLGSGRHSLLYDIQLKGNGRNALAIRTDFSHAWGGSFIWQSLKSYAITVLLKGMLPQGILETEMISLYRNDEDDQKLTPSSRALQFRSSKGLRVTQICIGIDPHLYPNQKQILSGLLTGQGLKYSSQLFEKSLFMYASMFMNGLKHLSVTKENITLEGQLLDYEDVEYLTDKENYSFQIYLKIAKKEGQQIPNTSNLLAKEFVPFLKRAKLYTSTIHHAVHASQFAHIGLTFLDPKFKQTEDQINKRFMKVVKNLMKNIFETQKVFVDFTEELCKLKPAYFTGDLSGSDGDVILPLLKRYKVLQFEIINNKIEPHLMTLTVEVKLPRPKLKNKILESFNEGKHNITIESQVSVMLKYLQLKIHSSKFELKDMLEYTSLCHKTLSKSAKIFPYLIHNGVIKEKNKTMNVFSRELKKIIEKEKGLRIANVDFSQIEGGVMVQKKTDFDHFKKIRTPIIVQALEVILPNSDSHCLALEPQFINSKND
jgi:hypothetical protein